MTGKELLTQQLGQATTDIQRFEAHSALASDLMDDEQYDEAREHLTQSLEYIEASGRSEELPGIYANIGICYSRSGNEPEGFNWTQRALDSLSEFPASRSWGRIHYNMANYHAARSSFDAAQVHFDEAIPYLRAQEKWLELAEALNNKGIAFGNVMDYSGALACFSESLSIREQINDGRGVSFSLGNIGALYMYINEHEKALDYLHKSLELKREVNDYRGIAGSLCNIGETYRKLKDFDAAFQYYKQAEQMSLEHGVNHFMPNILHCIAVLYYQSRNLTDAIVYAARSLEFSAKRDESYMSSRNSLLLGKIYLEDDALDLVRSREYLQRAQTFENTSKAHSYELAEALSLLEERDGDLASALHHYREYHRLKEQSLSEDVKKTAIAFDISRKGAERDKNIEIERAIAVRERNILNNILPEGITTRLMNGENPIADTFESVSILFMDIVSFTTLSMSISAQQLVYLLNSIFSAADAVMLEYGLEKIKTIGDAYMAVAGAPLPVDDHALRAAKAASKLVTVMRTLEISMPSALGDTDWIRALPEIHVRIGLHCGTAAAGVVGQNKFLYDLWGDAVNTAARMESSGEANRVHCSDEFALEIRRHNTDFVFRDRGEIEVKGKGKMRTWFLETA